LRDDIATLFEALLPLQQEKLTLLEALYLSNREKRTLIKTGSPEATAAKVENELHIVQDIDCIDAKIAALKKEISKRCGILENEFNTRFSSIDDSHSKQYFDMDNQILQLEKKAMRENTAFLHELESILSSTKKDIEELRRIAILTGKIRRMR
jgi:uncharacterized small protein (DUF1192 family)